MSSSGELEFFLNVKNEILETEKSYVESLQLVKKKYLDVIEKEGILSKEQTAMVFSNIETIRQTNENFLKQLEANTDTIGKVFLDNADLMKHYAVYCSNQPRINYMIKKLSNEAPEFAVLQKQNMNESMRFLSLEDFLIMPMQRITKYPLLLGQLYKAIQEDDPDKAYLKEAKEKIMSITQLINERVRKVQNIQQLINVQEKILNGEQHDIVKDDRTLIHEGRLKVKRSVFSVNNTSLEDSYSFLFNDKLLVCSKEGSDTLYTVKFSVCLQCHYILEIEDEKSPTAFTLTTTLPNGKDIDKKYKMKALTSNDRVVWIQKLTECLDKYKDRLIRVNSLPNIVAPIEAKIEPRSRRRSSTVVEYEAPSFKEPLKRKSKSKKNMRRSVSLKNMGNEDLISDVPIQKSGSNRSTDGIRSRTSSRSLDKNISLGFIDLMDIVLNMQCILTQYQKNLCLTHIKEQKSILRACEMLIKTETDESKKITIREFMSAFSVQESKQTPWKVSLPSIKDENLREKPS